MKEAFPILLCVLAIFGLYALFSRLAVMLLPRGAIFVSVDGRDRTKEEILFLAEYARLFAERERRVSSDISVLLNENEQEKAIALRKEGILVYTIKS